SVQTPPQQLSPGSQTTPQAPQPSTSVFRSVHWPPQQAPAQHTRSRPELPHSLLTSEQLLQTFSQPARSGPGNCWHHWAQSEALESARAGLPRPRTPRRLAPKSPQTRHSACRRERPVATNLANSSKTFTGTPVL